MAPMHVPIPSKASAIRASVLHGPQDLRLETRSIEDPGIGELQVAIQSTGICGSDVSYYKKFANGDLCACMPLSLGHESSGTVVAVGPQASGFRVGDRVALEVGVACGQCSICRKGRYNLCKKMRFRSSAKSYPHFQGTLQERINHPAVWCHKLPDHISFDAAALLEPLSVAIHAVNRAGPAPGSTALVTGAGTVGLLTAAMARQAGCSEVTITDIDAGRVGYAIEHGFATHGFVVPHSSNEQCRSSSASGTSTPAQGSSSGSLTPNSSIFSDTVSGRLEGAKGLAADILSLTTVPGRGAGRTDEELYRPEHGEAESEEEDDGEHEGFDVAFECTGKEICMQTSLYAARPGGRVVMVGMGTPVQTLPLSAAHLREVDILGIFRYASTYPTGIRLLSASASSSGNRAGIGCLPSLEGLVTHRFRGLDSARRAFELAGRTSDDEGNLVIKVVIEADG